MHAFISALHFSPATVSTIAYTLTWFAIGLVALVISLAIFDRFGRRLTPFLIQLLFGSLFVLEFYFGSLIQARAGLGWTVAFTVVLFACLGVYWLLDQSKQAEAKLRANLPTCPYCKSTRISTQANYTTATCLNCGHTLHIEQR